MKRYLTYLLAMISAAFLMTACSQKAEEKASEASADTKKETVASETIRIGVPGAHSGDLASYGLPTVNAVKLYVEEVNKNGGINGKMVELFIEDDACKPELATNTANKLVANKVVAVIGHTCSGPTKAALNIYKDAKIVVMSPSATDPLLTSKGEYPNFARSIAPDDAQAKLQTELALDKLGAKKIAILHDKGDYGKGLAEYARTFIQQDGKGAEVVLFEGITVGAVDYSAVVQKIARSGADAVLFGGYHPEASKIVTQLRKKQNKVPFISADGVKDDMFIRVAGEYAEGVYATGPTDTTNNPINIKAVEDHRTVFGTEPGAFFINGYTSIMAVLNAIEKANSTEYEAVNNALRTEYVETPFGNISYDEKGDAIGIGFTVYQVQNGAYVELD